MSGPDDGNTILALMLAWGAVCWLTGYVLGYCGRRHREDECRAAPMLTGLRTRCRRGDD